MTDTEILETSENGREYAEERAREEYADLIRPEDPAAALGITPDEPEQDPKAVAARERLEYLRGELRGERISWGELHELQGLASYIEAGDTELLEAAGVPEHAQDDITDAEPQDQQDS